MTRLRTGVGPEDHIRGSPGAAITIVEYADFACEKSAAAYWVLRSLPVDRFRLVYRHFPMTQSHPRALTCAEAAEAAAAQGRFWAMHDAIYENPDALSEPALWAYAAQAGLDLDAFIVELHDHRHQLRIERDVMSGVRSGVLDAPCFFVNGEQYDGPLERLVEPEFNASR